MTPFTRLAVLALVACAHAQYQEERAPRYIASEPKAQASTPVPILKQINRSVQFPSNTPSSNPKRSTVFFHHLQHVMNLIEDPPLPSYWHNEDGSYTYGYEAADGSFKIETKSPTGEVKGKYGYKDDTGKVRVVEYGANKYGFQPAGEGITVAPPTLVDETKDRDDGGRPGKSQSNHGQYRPAPAQAVDYDYNDEPAPPRPAPRPQYRPQPAPQPQYQAPAPQPQYRAPAPQPQHRAPPPTQQPQYRVPTPSPQPQPQYRPAPQQQPQYRQSQGPAPPKPAFFAGAAPSPTEDNFFNPEPPQRRQYQQPKQDFRSQFPDFAQDYSSPSAGPAPLAPRPSHQSQPYSMLDQLLKEYALPSNGAPALHDITFGTY